MAGEGRPTLCTPEVTAIVAEGIGMGLSIRAACGRASISAVTHYAWLKRGADGEEPYANYVNACEKAHAAWVQNCLAKIDAAGEKPQNWTAIAWRLERADPESFGRREKTAVEVTGKGGNPIELVHLSTADLIDVVQHGDSDDNPDAGEA